MNKPLLVSLASVAGIVVMLGAGCSDTSTPVIPPTQQTTTPPVTSSTTTPPPATNQTYTSKAGTFSFEYPASFTVSETTPGAGAKTSPIVEVKTPWYLEDTSPATGEMIKYAFDISLEERAVGIDEAITKAEGGYAKAYNDLKAGKTSAVDSNFAGSTMVGGKSGYYFNSGAEGTNMRQIFVAKNTSTTLVATIHYVGSSSASRLKPSMLSEKEQLDMAQTLLNSVKFLK